jgi:hypothetical protein
VRVPDARGLPDEGLESSVDRGWGRRQPVACVSGRGGVPGGAPGSSSMLRTVARVLNACHAHVPHPQMFGILAQTSMLADEAAAPGGFHSTSKVFNGVPVSMCPRRLSRVWTAAGAACAARTKTAVPMGITANEYRGSRPPRPTMFPLPEPQQ